ncbi:MAG: AAC(3) family N-acetyltransferase [Gemmatimonadales bacterium]
MTRAGVRQQLHDLGLRPGCVLLVHSAFSKVAPIEGGPIGLIAALGDAVGPGGTLIMPSMTDDDDHPFDARTTPCRGLGVVPDTFWRLPNVRRSSNPHAFAARGPAAAFITATHPLDFPHGPNSPVGRVHALGGLILLLGVGHDANTTVHLAESLAGVRYRRPKHVTVLQGGQPARLAYTEIDHCCQNFSLVDTWLDGARLQQRGVIGHGEARLVASRTVVDIVTAQLRRDETVFLHAHGVDPECDEARGSLAGTPARGAS